MHEKDSVTAKIWCTQHNMHPTDCFVAHHPNAHKEEAMTKEMFEDMLEQQHEGLQDGSLKWVNGEIVPVEAPEPEIIVLEVPIIQPPELVPGHGTNCVCQQCCAAGASWQMQVNYGNGDI